MADSKHSTPSAARRGAGKSATRKWEEAASHRDRDDPTGHVGELAGGDTATKGGTGQDDARREAFLHTRDGVFYPSGYAVLGLAPSDAAALRDALAAAGVARDDMMLLAPEEAAAVMRETDREAGVLARIVGAEIRNAHVMGQLAESGAAFLIVRVPDDDAERLLVATARRWRVRKALRYHALAVEELRVGVEEVPGDSPYGVNEVLRSKPTEARLKPQGESAGRRRGGK